MDEKTKEKLYSGWKKAIKRSLNWEKWEKEE
jgi:glycerol kinase